MKTKPESRLLASFLETGAINQEFPLTLVYPVRLEGVGVYGNMKLGANPDRWINRLKRPLPSP